MATGKKWWKGHTGRFWDNGYRNLPYIRQPITQAEVDSWVCKGYDYVKNFTGEMYDNRNPMPEWVDGFKKMFDFKNLTCTFYRMNTLEIMPEHVDQFKTYMKLTGARYENVYRILLMLEDWKPGHYLEIDGEGIVNWVSGDYFVWESSTPHSAANIGVEPRYTLQLTGEKNDRADIWKKLHWYNIPGLTVKEESLDRVIMQPILRKGFSGVKKPFYIYMYNNKIEELETIVHDQFTIDYLNKEGVDFYLYEPLCSYKVDATKYKSPFGTKHNRLFYSEFIGNEDPSSLRADELNSILDYANRNKLTNITVHACDYNIEETYPYCNDKIKLIGDDLYVKTANPIKVKNKNFQENFTKKFISANWRYASHRHLIAAAVAPLDSYVSWYYKCDFSNIANGEWYSFDRWKENESTKADFDRMIFGMQYLNQHSPINLDLSIKTAKLITDTYFFPGFPDGVLYDHTAQSIKGDNNALETFYSDVFCDVVTESRFAQPTANYSEKVFQPMWYKKPYILVAPPYTLKLLKQEGFKTFSDFWDESYDLEEIHEQRMLKIFKVIDFINNKSMDELRVMYENMKPILSHNYNVLKKWF